MSRQLDITARRLALADALRTVPVPGRETGTEGATFTVLDQPADSPPAPSIVIGPRAPYVEALTFAEWRVNVTLTILLQRAAPDGLAFMESVLAAILTAIPRSASWSAISLVGITQAVGGVEYLTATIDVSLL